MGLRIGKCPRWQWVYGMVTVQLRHLLLLTCTALSRGAHLVQRGPSLCRARPRGGRGGRPRPYAPQTMMGQESMAKTGKWERSEWRQWQRPCMRCDLFSPSQGLWGRL